ncbi:hypothetical protein GW17_00060780 [Ensete ventricosum]|nr:hypothetical protein GW17_00060780 [Ensete ventricosum]
MEQGNASYVLNRLSALAQQPGIDDGGSRGAPLIGQAQLAKEEAEVEYARVRALEKAQEVMVGCKESSKFKLGLQRLGQVSYEYKYQVTLAKFRAKYPNLEVEENLFTSLPEDDDVPIEEVPFDDSPAPSEA